MRRGLLVLCLMLAGCSEDGEAVDGAALEQLFRVEQVARFSFRGVEGVATFRTDRGARLNVAGQGNDSGRWWIEGDQFCVEWQRALSGRTRCASLRRLTDDRYAVRDRDSGRRIGELKLTPGRVE